MTEETLRGKVVSQVLRAAQRASDAKAFGAPDFDEIVSKGYVVIGSPDEVAEQLREVAHSLNVGQLMLLLQFGNMDRQLTGYNTELFAKRVMPQLRDLFEDEWENRWWPQPLPREERAVPRRLDA
jgi:alkanesulfonate monooxygenase SsuD/methylene tetrahydromethanopterin reductase-like flavin-dependent oxidoreductase (luciferase family)